MFTSRKPKKPRIKRPGAVIVISLLLLLQSIALFTLGAFSLISTSWRFNITLDTVVGEFPHALRGSFFIALAWLAVVVAINFFYLRSTAWISAVMLQGLNLLMALGVYLRGKAPYGYLMMLYSIFMVIYLNYSEVQTAFRYKHEISAPRDR